jgi:hypothetical protein
MIAHQGHFETFKPPGMMPGRFLLSVNSINALHHLILIGRIGDGTPILPVSETVDFGLLEFGCSGVGQIPLFVQSGQRSIIVHCTQSSINRTKIWAVGWEDKSQ